MKKLDKKFGVLIVLSLFLLPSLVMADEGVTSDSSTSSNVNQGDSSLYKEHKTKLGELLKSLEESLKSLKESVTSDNLEEIKSKAESLKTEYVSKFKEAGAPEEAVKKLEERFDIFLKNLDFKQNTTGVSQELATKLKDLRDSLEKSLSDLKKSLTSDNLDEVKAKAESLKEEYISKFKELGASEYDLKKLEERLEVFYKFQIEKREKQGEIKKDNKGMNLDQQSNGNQGLMQKYKQQFAKKLESKLADLTSEQLNTVITKIDSAIESYKSSDLSQDKKDKLTMQLNAIKELLQEKLDEMDNGINLDTLFNN